jgi:hypothetical protein
MKNEDFLAAGAKFAKNNKETIKKSGNYVGKVAYDHREQIAQVAYDNREYIA